MTDIVLATANARYSHASLGLRYLLANMGDLRSRAFILEFDISQNPRDMLERLLARSPRIVALGVHIWNVSPLTDLAALLRRVRPDIRIVLGGPEVSHETDGQPIVALADHVIRGESDLAFADLCRALLAGTFAPRIVDALPPDLDAVVLPYGLYDAEDIANRNIYVEFTRGCPFSCAFCLSAIDGRVRRFPDDRVIAHLGDLWDRGARRFKLVDRSVHLAGEEAVRFFLERAGSDMHVHFELVPDRMTDGLRDLLARFPAGSLQIEAGIQTFDETVACRIGRKQDAKRVEEAIRFLVSDTHAHVHADLVAGLPGETLAGLGAGFDRLFALGPQEIQVGILKRLRGTPLARRADEWGLVFSPFPPYEVLETPAIGFPDMQRLKRFSRYFDLVANSGNFTSAVRLLLEDGSPFERFLEFSDWLHAATGETREISQKRMANLLSRYLVSVRGLSPALVEQTVGSDLERSRRPRRRRNARRQDRRLS